MIFGSKGKMEILLEKMNFKLGETIKGTLVLEMKEPVEARGLNLRFIAEREEPVSQSTPKNQRGGAINLSPPRMRKVTLHEFKLELGIKQMYSGKLEYPFEIAIPDKSPVPEIKEGILGGMIKAAQVLGSAPKPIQWYLVGNLDIPFKGDITKKTQINIV